MHFPLIHIAVCVDWREVMTRYKYLISFEVKRGMKISISRFDITK